LIRKNDLLLVGEKLFLENSMKISEKKFWKIFLEKKLSKIFWKKNILGRN